MNIRELLEQRAGLITQARSILDQAEGANRDLTAEEQTQWDNLMNQAVDIRQRVDREERMLAAEQGLAGPHTVAAQTGPGSTFAFQFESRGMLAANQAQPGWMETPEWRPLVVASQIPRYDAFRAWLRNGANIRAQEQRALQADSDTAGGYLVTPMQFVDRLIKAIDDQTFVRQWATAIAVPNAESLGAPMLTADPADADWTAEIGTVSEDSTMAVGRRQLTPHQLTKLVKVSIRLLRLTPDAEALVRARLAYKFGITFEKGCLTGSGAQQPLGVFTASADGISTSRDASTGNTTTEIRFDGLIEAKYTLKQGYWARARWIFHRDAVKQIAKLKDGEGQYLWRESVRVGEPDTVLGFAVGMSEYAPNTFTTGLYVGILGDFSNYWIADAMNMELQRLVELYAATSQVGLVGRFWSDGMPVLEEAFVRVTLA